MNGTTLAALCLAVSLIVAGCGDGVGRSPATTAGRAGESSNATSVLQHYLNAFAAGRWAGACRYLAGSIQVELRQMGGSTGISGCAKGMRTVIDESQKAGLRAAARIHVLGMELKGGQAFVVYRDGEGARLRMPMFKGDKGWRVGALVGSVMALRVAASG